MFTARVGTAQLILGLTWVSGRETGGHSRSRPGQLVRPSAPRCCYRRPCICLGLTSFVYIRLWGSRKSPCGRPARRERYGELGLVGALEQRGRSLSRPEEFAVTVVADRLPPLPSAVETAAYRIAVEAMSNSARHACAGQCRVTIAADAMLHVTVEDDGIGLPALGKRILQAVDPDEDLPEECGRLPAAG
jgi:hypothetical protein